MKEELEKAANDYSDNLSVDNLKLAFKNGAKWAQERMFTEKEVLAMLHIKYDAITPEYVLQQFKKLKK